MSFIKYDVVHFKLYRFCCIHSRAESEVTKHCTHILLKYTSVVDGLTFVNVHVYVFTL